ncbi:MAG: TonB family protein [Vicinamibacteria bacterium]
MAEKDRSSPPIPRTIGRYQIQSLIGSGAMGAVYKGFDPLIKRTLAIKTIRLDIPRGSDEYKTFLERFYQEARISGTLSHPNIVTLFDIGEENGVPFLALEFVEGETVEALLDKGVRFKPEKAIGLVSQIASALDYAHSKGVIHRDIKPANLLLYGEDKVKVTDFGIAKLADSEMTRQGQLLGTPSYMSPEQAMGEKLDGRSDIFSLGICAFEMLSGQQPFPGNNVTAILYKLVNVEPVHPTDLEMNGLIPQKWHEVFGKVLSKKREERYQTAADFVRDLEYCLGSWFTGIESLAEEPEPQTIAMSAAELPAPPPVPEAPAPAPPPAASRVPPPSPLAGRQADDPSIVVSFDEVTMPMPVPQMPAAGDEEDLPETINLSAPRAAEPVDAGEATMVVGGSGVSEDDLPPTVAIQRPAVEKTVLLPTPGTAPPAAPPPGATAPPTARQTGMGSSRPGSLPPFKLKSPLPGRPSGRLPGSRPPGPRSAPPGSLSVPAIEPEMPGVPTRQGLSAGVVIGVGAALLIGAILIGVLLFARSRSQGPVPGATPSAAIASLPAGNGSLVVNSQPAGAAISVNGVEQGAAPVTVEGIALGSYEVVGRLTEHEPDVKTVTLDASATRRDVNLSLSPSRTEIGEADILSRPAGASVVMDGAKVGLTPLRGFKLRVGNRQFELRTEGYQPWRGWLSVRAGESARLEARMVLEGEPEQAPAPVPTAAADAATPSPPAPAAAPPTPRPSASRPPRPAPASPTPAAVAAATPTPAPPPATAPASPAVDPGRVYRENEVDAAPRKLSGDSYTPKLRSGETVSVTLSWVVSETGEVGEIEIVESGGKPLDDAVAAAIKRWRYAPGAKQGVKVKVRMAPRKYTFRAG